MGTLTGEVQRVAETVMERILAGTYPRGLRLPAEAALASELSCGRSTVREALRHLADLGLVKSRRGSGAMVLDFRHHGTPALLPTYLRVGHFDTPPALMAREMLRMRTMMATEAVRLAARYASDDDLAEARARLAEAPALESDPAAHALNELEIYRALVVASGMWPAAWMVNAFWQPLGQVNTLFAPAMGPVSPAFQPTMETLIEQIAAHDEDGAVATVERWFGEVDAKLRNVIELALGATTPSQPS